MRRRTLLMAAAAGGLAASAAAAWQPDRALRLVIPFAPGGPADIFGRVFAEALAPRLGQPVVAENRSGAGGVTGVDAVAKAAPDGHALALAGAGALAVAPAMPTRLPLDVQRDLAHLTLVARVPEVLVTHPRAGFTTLADLIAAAKARPGALQYGSAGVGTITHLAGALLAKEAGIEVGHVPYRGAAPAVTDLLAERFAFLVADVPVLLPHIQAGALRPLAVTTARRVGVLPQVPTTAELGLQRVVSDNWYGLAAPAATPPAALARLHEAAFAALRDPVLAREFARHEALPSPMTREEYAAFLRAEAEKWAPLVRETGASAL